MQIKLTEDERRRYRAEAKAAGDRDLSAMVRRLVEAAIAGRSGARGG